MTSEGKRFPLSAAAIAGTLENIVTYPFEFVKTQMQLQVKGSSLYAGADKYAGPMDCVARTLRASGVPGLYNGGKVFFLFAPPRALVRFNTFERLRDTAPSQRLRRQSPGGKRASDLLCGIGAGVADAAICQTPCNQIQVKMVHDMAPKGPRRYRGLMHAVASIKNEFGWWRGFYSGLAPTVAKVSFCAGIRFVGYGELADQLRARPGRSGGADAPIAIWESMAAGGVAGGISAVASQPIDVVRANIMGLDAKRYPSSLACFMSILRGGGVSALYLGIGPRVCRVFAEEGLKFSLFELAERQLCKCFAR